MLIELKAAQTRLALLFKETGLTMAEAQRVAGNQLDTVETITEFIDIETEARRQLGRLSALYRELFPTRHSKPSAYNRSIYNRAKQIYLNSHHWRRIKDARLELSRYKCEAQMRGCTGKATAVHHLSYVHLGDEALWDLRCVCESCHKKVSMRFKK